VQIQPQLILLQKTLLNVEGLGRELYPELDIWSTASPILREWMRERTSVRALVHELRTHAPELIAAARSLPALLRGVVQRQAGVPRTQTPAPEISELRAELRAARRRDTTLLGLAYLGGGLFWLALSRAQEWPGWVLLAAGVGIIAYGLRR
jgi:ubiquinone biosynthesis protein